MLKTHVKIVFTLFLWTICVGPSALASQLTFPNTFVAGTPAKASEVNDNFAAVKTAVDDNFASLPMVWASTDENAVSIDVNPYVGPIETNALSITVPSDGLIIISGSVSVNWLPSTASASLTAYVDGSAAGSGPHASTMGTITQYTPSYTITVPIAAGTHTVSQEIKGSGVSFVGIRSNNLTVMFFPTAQGSYNSAP